MHHNSLFLNIYKLTWKNTDSWWTLDNWTTELLTYFSTLGMTSSFHQIDLNPTSRPYTAFSTTNGHFQYTRLPFGLKISSNSFQRMLSLALSGLDSQAFLYVDDIIVFGCSLDHNDNLIKVFDRLSKYNLKLNPNKCEFLKTEVLFGSYYYSYWNKTWPTKFGTILTRS